MLFTVIYYILINVLVKNTLNNNKIKQSFANIAYFRQRNPFCKKFSILFKN